MTEDAEKDPVLQEKIAQNRQTLDDYPGFDAPDQRRAADESLRRYVAQAVGDMLQQIASLDVCLARKQVGDLRGVLATTGQRIEMVVDKLQSVPYAFSPFYQVDWLPTDTQYRIVNDDHRLIEIASEVARFLAPTLRDDSDFGAIAARAAELIGEVDERLETRVNTIMEFQG